MNQNICPLHKLSFSILQMEVDKAKILCEQCYFTIIEGKRKLEFENFIYLRNALNSTTYLVSKSNIREDFPDFVKWMKNDENEILKQSSFIEKQIHELQATLNTLLKEFQNQVQLFISSKQQIVERVNQTIHYDKFKDLFKKLNEQGMIEEVEVELFQYFNSFKKEEIQQFLQSQAHVIPPIFKLDSFNNQVKELNEILSKHCADSYYQYQYIFDESELLSGAFKVKLKNQIEEKSKRKILKAKIIFLGSKDGLNANSFWNKVNGKSNLFFVFKSETNNSIFGGYSPCQWLPLKKHMPDDTVSSFLFSQTNNEIYPLKQEKKQYGIWVENGVGPIFGANDMHIQADFQKGHSGLGFSYYWQDYKNVQNAHLFGGLQPNISECEIFEVTFE